MTDRRLREEVKEMRRLVVGVVVTMMAVATSVAEEMGDVSPSSSSSLSVEEMFQAALEKESVKDTMKALMALDDASEDGRVDRVELEEILKSLFPSRSSHDVVRREDYVRPASRLPYVFDAITPESLSIDWSESDVATIFARFDEDADGKIMESEVDPKPSDTGVLSRFARAFFDLNTPRADTRRMWSILKNLTCSCSETDEAENFAETTYSPCLVDSALSALDEDERDRSSYCKISDDSDAGVLSREEFRNAAKPIFQFKQLSEDLSFSHFRRFVLEEPAEITHAISHLIYVGAYPAARALLLQQIMLASSDLFNEQQFEEEEEKFEINDVRYRKMLEQRRRSEIIELATKALLVAAALGVIFYFLHTLAKTRTKLKSSQLAVAYLSGLSGLGDAPAPSEHFDLAVEDDHDLAIVLDNAFQAGLTDAARHRRRSKDATASIFSDGNLDSVARSSLRALEHELHGRPPCGAEPGALIPTPQKHHQKKKKKASCDHFE